MVHVITSVSFSLDHVYLSISMGRAYGLSMLINDYQCSSNETDSDSKIGSQLSTRDPEVGPYEFYCHLDAMLDISQKAIDQKKFNTMATSVLIDKYDNVTFNDGDATMDATRYKSNSSNETKS
jgi:hypothetical protein